MNAVKPPLKTVSTMSAMSAMSKRTTMKTLKTRTLAMWRSILCLASAVAAASALHAQQVQTTVTLPDGRQMTVTTPAIDGALQDMSVLREKLLATQGDIAAGPTSRLKTGTSRISGRVLTETGQPARQASVSVSAPELNGSKRTTTDQDGRYEIGALPAGRYVVSGSKANYIGLNYGQARPAELTKPVDLADNQHIDRIDLTLPRGGVIAGRVLDEYGEPVTDAPVTPMQKRMLQGLLRLLPSGRSTTTNDIGEFRIFGLPPGQYYVSTNPRQTSTGPVDGSDARFGYAPTYYPSTSVAASARAVAVGLSETVGGIDLSLTTMRLATISGTTLDGQGMPLTRGSVSATDRGGTTSNSAGGTIRPDGTFTMPALPPGEYILRATALPAIQYSSTPSSPPAPGLQSKVAVAAKPVVPPEILMASVSVNGSDISGVVLTPLKQVTISGRVVFDRGAGASLRSDMVNIRMLPGSPEASLGIVSSGNALVMGDFSFRYMVPAAELALRVSVQNPDWVVRAIRVGGLDITDSGVDLRGGRDVDGVEVQLTNHPPEISGLIVDANGAPQIGAVLMFPQERERWIFESRLIATARTDRDGRYKVRTLPPGRYLAVVLDPSQVSIAMQDPDMLEGLRDRATPFSLSEGESKTLDLRSATGR